MAQIINRGPKTYLIRVFLGRDPDTGKRRFQNQTFRGLKKSAKKRADRIEEQVSDGTWNPNGCPSDQTVKDFLEYWLDHTAARKVADYTLVDYRALTARYLVPLLGDMKLGDLAPADVQRLITDLEGRGLSPRTVRYAHGVLRNALNKAVREGTIPSNPASAKMVDLPKRETRELTVLSPDEAKAFIEAANEDRWAALWILLISSGARPGEALGLKWDDFDGKNIRIQRALVRDRKGGGWTLKEPKTKKSRRTVPLPAVASQALKDHRRRQAAEKLAGGDYSDERFIFADETGGPLAWDEIARQHFGDLLTQGNLPTLRAYDLRHTCASLLLAAGVNPKIVSERLGHSTVVLTLDTYSSVLPGLQEEATELLGAVLGG